MATTPIPDTPQCVAAHCGAWACDPRRLEALYSAVMSHVLVPMSAEAMEEQAQSSVDFTTTDDGIAIIPIHGVMQRGFSKFSGTCSTNYIRKQLRAAARDERINGVMLMINSPGGQVAGTDNLADEIRRVSAIKPIRAYVEDFCASAAYWIASGCDLISAEPTARVGCIGVYGVITDESGAAERAGIKVHVVATGKYKGAGYPGTPVSDDVLAMIKSEVDECNEFFLSAIESGRKMTRDKLITLADGRDFIASVAASQGLIDRVERFDDAIANFQKEIETMADKKAAPPPEEEQSPDVTPGETAPETPNTDPATTPEPGPTDPEKNPEDEELATAKEDKAKNRESASASDLVGFQALADAEGYEFAKANFGKTEREIYEARIAKRDAELSALRKSEASSGADPVPAMPSPAAAGDNQRRRPKNPVRDAINSAPVIG